MGTVKTNPLLICGLRYLWQWEFYERFIETFYFCGLMLLMVEIWEERDRREGKQHPLTDMSTSFRFSGHKTRLPNGKQYCASHKRCGLTPNDVLPSAKTIQRSALIYFRFYAMLVLQ